MKPPVFREVSTYFFIEYHDTTHGIKFLYQNIRETTKNLNKNQLYQVTKKKNARYLFITVLGGSVQYVKNL